jgi:L-threonylcarbamoyladenylate synthase
VRISLHEACSHLAKGGIVAIPTDTVYGLAADPKQPDAVQRLLEIKGRPSTNPMIILVGDRAAVGSFVERVPPGFDQLTERFWPGALTLVIPVDVSRVSESIRAGRPSAGFRMPDEPVALDLLNNYGPLVVTSANRTGKISATSAELAETEFPKIPVLQECCRPRGIESTVLIHTEAQWQAVRIGAISLTDIEPELGYLPKLVIGEKQLVLTTRLHLSEEAPEGAVVVGFAERNYPRAGRVFRLGSLSHPHEIAAALYATLRQLDEEEIEEAWVDMNFPKEGILAVVAERLQSCQQ